MKRLRARTTEEQMLAITLVAGVAFAVVSLVGFVRPGNSGSTASAKGPTINTSGHSPPRSTPTSESNSPSVALVDVPAPAGTIMEQLQNLFSSVLSPFSTNLPMTAQSSAANIAIQRPGTGSTTTTTFPIGVSLSPETTLSPAVSASTVPITTNTAAVTSTTVVVAVTTPTAVLDRTTAPASTTTGATTTLATSPASGSQPVAVPGILPLP